MPPVGLGKCVGNTSRPLSACSLQKSDPRLRAPVPDRCRSACSTPDSGAAADDASGRRSEWPVRGREPSRSIIWPGVWPGAGSIEMSLAIACSSPISSACPAANDRQHAVGDVVAGARERGRARRPPIIPFALRDQVARVRKRRHPAAVFQPRVPADMIDMQVRAQHDVDVLGRDAGRAQGVEPGPAAGDGSAGARAPCRCRRRHRPGR